MLHKMEGSPEEITQDTEQRGKYNSFCKERGQNDKINLHLIGILRG